MNYAPAPMKPVSFALALTVIAAVLVSVLLMAYCHLNVPVVFYSMDTGLPVRIQVENKVVPFKRGQELPKRHYSIYVEK